MYDDVLLANKRGHTIQQVREAMHMLRSYAFKISIHLMPWLYMSTIQKDIDTFRLVFEDERMKPDEIKFYPTSVIPNTELYELYRSHEYIPLTTQQIKDIIKTVQTNYIPPYTRIKRLIRDIPATEIAAWSMVTNLRQLVDQEMLTEYHDDQKRLDHYHRLYNEYVQHTSTAEFMTTYTPDMLTHIISADWSEIQWAWIQWIWIDIASRRNFISLDTRSREIHHRSDTSKKIYTIIRQYTTSNGKELFVSIEDELWYIFGFVRLSLPTAVTTYEWLGWAMIRELHVYGQVASLTWDSQVVQHTGIGRELMNYAQHLALVHGYTSISVISGVWVRQYYTKLWYELVWTYMTKELENLITE